MILRGRARALRKALLTPKVSKPCQVAQATESFSLYVSTVSRQAYNNPYLAVFGFIGTFAGYAGQQASRRAIDKMGCPL